MARKNPHAAALAKELKDGPKAGDDLREVQEELAKALEARVQAKADVEQRRGELRHAWEAYGAFEEEDPNWGA